MVLFTKAYYPKSTGTAVGGDDPAGLDPVDGLKTAGSGALLHDGADLIRKTGRPDKPQFLPVQSLPLGVVGHQLGGHWWRSDCRPGSQ